MSPILIKFPLKQNLVVLFIIFYQFGYTYVRYSQSQNVLAMDTQIALNRVKRGLGHDGTLSTPNMLSQQASNRFLKIALDGDVMTSVGNLFQRHKQKRLFVPR